MRYIILVGCSFIAVLVFIIIKEFPFDVFNGTEVENATALEDIATMTTLVTEVMDQLIHLEDETNKTINDRTIEDGNLTWNSNSSPIFSALRNFWVQASVGMIEPIDPLSEEHINENDKHVLRAIEHGLVEATTMLMNQIEETTPATLPSEQPEPVTPEQPVLTKRQGDESNKPEGSFNSNAGMREKNKRQTAFDLMANMSTSCSNCYEKLQTCVQQCFVDHNCHDIQRGVRACPPVPNRLCNPFTQWNPIDECVAHSDCKSPLLCCNDGCINKCLPGIWRS